MRTGILRIDWRHLRQALGLPKDVDLVDARLCFSSVDQVEIRIAHQGLPDVPDGHAIPIVNAFFYRDENGGIRFGGFTS